MPARSYFHLHLVSDATGETLINVGRAVAAQYPGVTALEHMHPLVRTRQQLDRVLSEIEAAPGIVLYTLVEEELENRLIEACRDSGSPVLSVLRPIFDLFRVYLGVDSFVKPGAQHMLNAEYFRRIDALNYTMMHDDGQLTHELDEADVVLLGISRTSKTPTAIYLANRGIKTANVPIVPGVPLPRDLETVRKPLVIGLIASPERIVQVRENRILANAPLQGSTAYTDRMAVSDEIAESRRLFTRRGCPVIDVTRRSIEETAAAILGLLKEHQRARIVET
ncbi:MAG: pyruvate, water dikinase regulatory protein [Labrys sp. (in: a-proteobacteria)]|jgi:regulator of PEP synthase PpsR (kinase-PPPase family)